MFGQSRLAARAGIRQGLLARLVDLLGGHEHDGQVPRLQNPSKERERNPVFLGLPLAGVAVAHKENIKAT